MQWDNSNGDHNHVQGNTLYIILNDVVFNVYFILVDIMTRLKMHHRFAPNTYRLYSAQADGEAVPAGISQL